MNLDKDTLQAQLNSLSADTQGFSENIRQRQEAIQKIIVEIEQYRGALAYNAQLVETVKKQLIDLAANATT